MQRTHLFILCGEAFAGKSSLSREISHRYKARIVGRDEVYFALEKSLALEHTPESDDAALWKNLWPLAVQGARNWLLLGESVVFDDNCLYTRQREELRLLATATGAQSVLIYMDVPADVLKERKERNKTTKERHDVPSAWLAENSKYFERPIETKQPLVYTHDTNLDTWFGELASRLYA